MKFWDTIAKMCGVEVRVAQAHVRGDMIGPFSMLETTPWTMTISRGRHRLAITARSDRWGCAAAINGHGVSLRDGSSTHYLEHPGIRIGLIDIERIRPMKRKSADWRPRYEAEDRLARAAAERLGLEAEANAQSKPTVLS